MRKVVYFKTLKTILKINKDCLNIFYTLIILITDKLI